MTKTERLPKARKLLAFTRRRLKKLEKIPLEARGHRDNEDVVKLRVQEKHLVEAIEKLSKKTRPRKKLEAAQIG